MCTVLVVDDSPLDRKIVGGIVEAEGMTATYAENGRDALDKLAEEKADIVLADLQMPVMDGLELVREVKERYPSTPVILVTRAGSEEIAVEALRTGASSYVPKRNLKRDLGRVFETVLSAMETLREQEQVRDLLQESERSTPTEPGRGPSLSAAAVSRLPKRLQQPCSRSWRVR